MIHFKTIIESIFEIDNIEIDFDKDLCEKIDLIDPDEEDTQFEELEMEVYASTLETDILVRQMEIRMKELEKASMELQKNTEW